MFIGHYGIALGAKKLSPGISLGTLVAASQLVDLIWPVMLLAGWEHVRIDPGNTPVTPLDFYDYPWTHSLLGATGWSIAFALAYYAVRRSRSGALTVGAVVFSHWILDLVSHRPDLSLAPGSSTMVGLGLWYSVWGTLLVEFALLVGGLLLYARTTTPKDRIGEYGLWAFGAILGAFYLVNLFGPPPPSAAAIAYAGNGGWLFVFWAAWIDRHRIAKEPLHGG